MTAGARAEACTVSVTRAKPYAPGIMPRFPMISAQRQRLRMWTCRTPRVSWGVLFRLRTCLPRAILFNLPLHFRQRRPPAQIGVQRQQQPVGRHYPAA